MTRETDDEIAYRLFNCGQFRDEKHLEHYEADQRDIEIERNKKNNK